MKLSITHCERRAVLVGVVGSRAYGTHRPDSDYDSLGVYQEDLHNLLSLNGAEYAKHSVHQTEPDMTFHELSKFMNLAVKGSPPVYELLHLPKFTTKTTVGKQLVDNRHLFAAQENISKVYLGMASGLLKRALNHVSSGNPRGHKEAFNAVRVLHQGQQFLHDGTLQVKLTKSVRKELNERTLQLLRQLQTDGQFAVDNTMRINKHRYTQTAKQSPLPEHVDMNTVNDLLYTLRQTQ